MKRWLRLALALALVLSCSQHEKRETADLLERLRALPGVQATEIAPPSAYARAFEILVTQPVDHHDPSRGTFQQRLLLSHRDEGKPMVLCTLGYGLGTNYVGELAHLLDANQLLVTHRYFPNARPTPTDWTHLTIAQAAADHHHIVELFRTIYPAAWVNTGASKGGMTAMYHRRFYPGDVRATVAYVAPLMLGTEDSRFGTFLFEQAGDEAGRRRIRQFQRHLLEHRQEFLPLVVQAASSRGTSYPLGAEASFEYAVLEFMFAFWQYGSGNTALIPGEEATIEQMWTALTDVSSPLDYSVESIDLYAPFWYQAFTELGYYPYYTEHLNDLLTAVPAPTYRSFAPAGVEMDFHPQAMIDVRDWLAREGHRFLYIYGALDPYTVAAVDDPPAGIDALKIVQPGNNHGTRIASLDRKEEVCLALERWLGITVDRSRLASLPPAAAFPDDPRRRPTVNQSRRTHHERKRQELASAGR